MKRIFNKETNDYDLVPSENYGPNKYLVSDADGNPRWEVTDATLTQSGIAADAAVVGERIGHISEEMENIGKPTDEQISAAVNTYLEENPVEATPVDEILDVVTINLVDTETLASKAETFNGASSNKLTWDGENRCAVQTVSLYNSSVFFAGQLVPVTEGESVTVSAYVKFDDAETRHKIYIGLESQRSIIDLGDEYLAGDWMRIHATITVNAETAANGSARIIVEGSNPTDTPMYIKDVQFTRGDMLLPYAPKDTQDSLRLRALDEENAKATKEAKTLTGNPSAYATFIQGGHEAGAVYPAWKYRIVSKDIFHITSSSLVKIAADRRLSIHYFDAQGNFLKDSGWLKNEYIIPENSYVRMCISAFPATVSEEYSYVADVDTLLSYVRINGITDRVEKIEQKETPTRTVELESADFKQGSIYNGSDDGGIKTCVSTKDFFVLFDVGYPLEIATRADNGNTWKARINFYDKDKKFISQVGYDYLSVVSCPSNAASYRLSISLIGEDGTDLDCTPNDVIDGYIKIVQHYSAAALLDKYLEDRVVEQEKTKVYAYSGKKVEIGTHDVRYEHYMDLDSFTSSLGTQGGAVYGNYLFIGHNTMSYINILDLSTKSYVGNIAFEPVSTYHCNNMNFGVEKYAESDVFPLLYISQENINEHKCIVMRITESDGVFSGEIVQTITYPEPSSVSMYYPNCVIDTDNNYLYVIGYKINGYTTKEGNALKVAKWELPKLADGDVMLDMSAAKDSFEMPFVSCTQGAIVHNGRIFQCYGVDWKTHGLYLCMINPDAHTVETKICLNDIGYYPEPEALFVWNNYLYMVPHQGSIVKFYF